MSGRKYCKNCGIAYDTGGGCGICKPVKRKALLCAAAPDLLDALNAMIGADGHADAEVHRRARALAFNAIARAEGRA